MTTRAGRKNEPERTFGRSSPRIFQNGTCSLIKNSRRPWMLAFRGAGACASARHFWNPTSSRRLLGRPAAHLGTRLPSVGCVSLFPRGGTRVGSQRRDTPAWHLARCLRSWAGTIAEGAGKERGSWTPGRWVVTSGCSEGVSHLWGRSHTGAERPIYRKVLPLLTLSRKEGQSLNLGCPTQPSVPCGRTAFGEIPLRHGGVE